MFTFEPVPEWLEAALEERVEHELRRLHIPGTMDGFRYFTAAITRAVQTPEHIQFTKSLYPDVAHRCGARPANVMRGMRTAIQRCWTHGGRETLDEMAGIHLTERPTSSEFIYLVAAYIRRGH